MSVAFATLFLGLVIGLQLVELVVGEGVARVELVLDGAVVAESAGPPWRIAVLLGLVGPPASGAASEPPPVPPPIAPAEPYETEAPPEILGAPAAWGGEGLAEERLPVAAGTPILERPDPRSPTLAILDAASELPVVERRDGWVRVRYGARLGWVAEGGAGAGPGGGSAAAPAARSADPEILARALARLGAQAASAPARLGPFVLRTDLADPGMLAFLDRVAAGVVGVYRERYGLDPGLGTVPAPGVEPRPAAAPAAAGGAGSQRPTPAVETVVLFTREADYRAFTEGDLALAGLEEGGFAGFGLAALYLGMRDREEAASLLVHELVHLLNTRALGPKTPAWLEEALAVDLGYSRIDPSGRLEPGSLGGRSRVDRRHAAGPGGDGWQVTVTTEGGRAALERALDALDRQALPPLATLTALSWRELVDPSVRELAYAGSAFFVRYLLASPRLAGGFRHYLRSIAAGGEGGGEELLEALGEDWDLLDPGFRRWLRSQSLQR
jgi:hypothetical protein